MRSPTGRAGALVATGSVFHYLGPALAVTLFVHLSPLTVAWLRLVVAALVLMAWRRPWRRWHAWSPVDRRGVVLFGATVAAMNTAFYLALDRLPLATVAVVEFVPVLALAALGARTPRAVLAVIVAGVGVWLVVGADVRVDVVGLTWAGLNAALFGAYLMLGHKIAQHAGRAQAPDVLATALSVAAALVLPAAVLEPHGLADPRLLVLGVAVGVSSTVIPYLCDLAAMAVLPRARYALVVTLMPVVAAVTGALVLQQYPTHAGLAGIVLVVLALTLRDTSRAEPRSGSTNEQGGYGNERPVAATRAPG